MMRMVEQVDDDDDESWAAREAAATAAAAALLDERLDMDSGDWAMAEEDEEDEDCSSEEPEDFLVELEKENMKLE